jgi:hypothetical protein
MAHNLDHARGLMNSSVGEDLVRWLAFPECPDCGGRTWYFGPRGGLAINLRCAGCKAWFNTVFLIGIDQMIQRIPGDDRNFKEG